MQKITLAGARVSAGLTQAEMARKIGVSRLTVLKWENGQTPVKSAYLWAMCKVTGFSVEDIKLPEAYSK